MKRSKAILSVISVSIPSLLTIALLEVTRAEMNILNPLSKSNILVLWNALQLIPAFVFAYISDRNHRKKALLATLVLGFIGGMILSFVGPKLWVWILIALTFNPLPIARAVLLDHFPRYSSLKIISVTFLAQSIPWMFYQQIGKIAFEKVTLLITFGTLISIVLVKNLFSNARKSPEHEETIVGKIPRSKIILTIMPFLLAQLSMYAGWTYLEQSNYDYSWIDISNFPMFLGILITLFYSKLPHMATITFFYTIGFGIYLLAFLICITGTYDCAIGFISMLSQSAILVGLYLPFVTEAIINMVGRKNKAIGSALIELSNAFALALGSLLFTTQISGLKMIHPLITACFFIAIFMQKKADSFRVAD